MPRGIWVWDCLGRLEGGRAAKPRSVLVKDGLGDRKVGEPRGDGFGMVWGGRKQGEPRGVRVRDDMGRQESGRVSPQGVRVRDGLGGQYLV